MNHNTIKILACLCCGLSYIREAESVSQPFLEIFAEAAFNKQHVHASAKIPSLYYKRDD
jgi:hypothetical protein